jgi:hypothetical protein
MKLNTIDKICNLENKIEILKKKILDIQKKHIGEITYENLKNLDFANIDFSDNDKDTNAGKIKKINLMDTLNLKEKEYMKQYKINTDNEHTNNKLKQKYDTEQKKKELIKMNTEKLNEINKKFNKEKSSLEEILSKLKKDREHKLNIKQLHDDKIVFLLDKITLLTEQNNSIRKNITKINNEIKALHKVCNEQIKKYQIEHKTKYKALCGGNNKNMENCKIKMRNMDNEKLECKLLFTEQYSLYLNQFYDLCNNYGGKETGIIKNCIIFTREQVQDKINELVEEIKKLKKNYYEKMDEEYLKTDYENEIEKLENKYKLKISEREKNIGVILNSIKSVIKQYKKKKKVKSREEIMEYIDDLKKQKLDLEFKNENLEMKYKDLIKLKMNIKPNCLEKLNNIKADSLKEIYSRKKECEGI